MVHIIIHAAIKIAQSEKSDITKCWWGYGTDETLLHC